MKQTSSRWILGVLFFGCLANSFFLLSHFRRAVASFWDLRALSNVERRYLQRGAWYRAVLDVQNQVPFQATLYLVSPAPPWYLAYFLYPRILKKGSDALADREKVRQQYPQDWILVYSEASPPEMKAYPPLHPQGS